jgi:hypothetical protein
MDRCGVRLVGGVVRVDEKRNRIFKKDGRLAFGARRRAEVHAHEDLDHLVCGLACYFVWLDWEVRGAREGVPMARGNAPLSEKSISILLSSRLLAFVMGSVGRE